MNFNEQVECGRLGERLVESWLKSYGCGIIPSYEFTGKFGSKAPRLMFGTKNLAIPDMDVCKSGNRVWAEVKTYFFAPFNRTLRAEVHGMQRRLYDQYVQVEQESGTPVYLFVLEVKTGALLGSFLQDLEAFPCLCLYCNHDLPCQAKLKNGLYFKRSNFEILHTFSETEIRRIALVWEEPVSHRALALSAH